MLPVAIFMVGTAIAADYGRRASDDELVHERRGRIIDAPTGAGIKDARVMMMWDVNSFSLNGSSSGCVFQRITTTDSDGNYVIPDVSKGLDVSHRSEGGLSGLMTKGSANALDYSWRMLVYKDGYISTEDALRLRATPAETTPWFTFSNNSNLFPKILSAGTVVRVAPIAMSQEQLTPQQEIVYLRGLSRASLCRMPGPNVDQPPEVVELYSDVVKRVRDFPCRLHPSTVLSGEVVAAYIHLIHDTALIQRVSATGAWGIPWRPVEAGVLCGIAADPSH